MDVLAADPEDAGTRELLAKLVNDPDAGHAVERLRSVATREPTNVAVRRVLGAVLRRAGDLPAATAVLEEAAQISPLDVEVHLQLAGALDAGGAVERAWDEFEWRLRAAAYFRPFPEPTWDGAPLPSGRLLVVGEGTVADQIRLARFYAQAGSRVANVVVTCHHALERLLRGTAGVDAVVADGLELEPFDVWVAAGSLPQRLRMHPEASRALVPYLHAEPGRVNTWRRLLPKAGGCVRVGIHWDDTAGSGALPLRTFERILARPDVRAFSLRRDAPPGELGRSPLRDRVADLGKFLRDLADAAAVIEALDLVITDDSSVAHLAGALGRPVWVLVPASAAWRNSALGGTSAWYPSMRRFAHHDGEGWDDLAARVGAALDAFTNGPA